MLFRSDAGYIDNSVRELTVQTSTEEGQSLKIYLISYRKVSPVFDIEPDIHRNQDVAYRIYFKNRDDRIQNEQFYKKFHWELTCVESPDSQTAQIGEVHAGSDGLQGWIKISQSGTYRFQGELADKLGIYSFDIPVVVRNTPPSGSLPETRTDRLKKTIFYFFIFPILGIIGVYLLNEMRRAYDKVKWILRGYLR